MREQALHAYAGPKPLVAASMDARRWADPALCADWRIVADADGGESAEVRG